MRSVDLSFILHDCIIKINLPFVQNTGKNSLQTCKFCKRTRACTLVTLDYLQLYRECFLYLNQDCVYFYMQPVFLLEFCAKRRAALYEILNRRSACIIIRSV